MSVGWELFAVATLVWCLDWCLRKMGKVENNIAFSPIQAIEGAVYACEIDKLYQSVRLGE